MPFRYDLWGGSGTDPVKEEDDIEVHCLIPNGCYITFKCASQTTLVELKEVSAAKKMIHALGR